MLFHWPTYITANGSTVPSATREYMIWIYHWVSVEEFYFSTSRNFAWLEFERGFSVTNLLLGLSGAVVCLSNLGVVCMNWKMVLC